MKYSSYKNYYAKNYNKDYRNSFYRPGDNVVAYNRGRRTENIREIRDGRTGVTTDFTESEVRSNQNSGRDRSSKVRTSINTKESGSTVRRSSGNNDVQNARATRTRTESVRTPQRVERAATAPVKVNNNERIPAERNIRRDTRSSSNVQRVPAQPTVRRAETVIRSSGTPNNTNEKSSTSRSSRGRG